MGRSYTFRPVTRLITLLLVGMMLLGGCQGITPIPSAPVAEESNTPSASSSASASAEATSTAAPTEQPTETTATSETATPDSVATDLPAPATSNPPTTADGLATIESLNQDLVPRRDQVELAVEYGRAATAERVARTQPPDVKVGDKQRFNISDQDSNTHSEITATLVLILDHALVYVEDGVQLDPQAVERSARRFNDNIYPRNHELFGSEWSPGVDGDPRLTILNARIKGAGGYFSGSDEVPQSVNRYSNEREMFYINIDSYQPGTDAYDSVLAHEFQHMIEWNESERPATWFNEGLSQLAEELNGFEESVINVTPAYLINPDLQLTAWADSPQNAIAHYGASYLFQSYFYQQYGKNLDLKQLIKQGAGERLNLYADVARQQNPKIQDFGDLYADWSIANLINDSRYGDGRYAYKQLPATVQPEQLNGNRDETLSQFGSAFYQIDAADSERVIRFDGSDTIGLVAAPPDGHAMWWSNRGDNADSSLSRTLDLRNVSSATLKFRLWYDIEADWDYGYVSVSTDGGKTFTTLASRHTTTTDPIGHNLGNGYTGRSGVAEQPGQKSSDLPAAQWIDEQIDLTPYAGKEIVLRFSVITDDAFNAPGMAIDNIQVPEIGFRDDAETAQVGWDARGFTRTDNRLPQQWELRFIRIKGRNVSIEPLTLDAGNAGELRLAPGERGALIVMATTPHTTERASYTLGIDAQ